MSIKKFLINYCQVHNRFQTRNGRWLDAGINQTELNMYAMHNSNGCQTMMTVSDICDECCNPDQKEIKFDLPDYKGTMSAKKS